MKKRLTAILCGLCLLLSGCSSGGDAVLGKGGETSLTQEQLRFLTTWYVESYGMSTDQVAENQTVWTQLKRELAQEILLNRLLAQEAETYGYSYTSGEAAAFEEEYSQNEPQGLTAREREWHRQFAEDRYIAGKIRQQITGDLEVTGEEAEAFYRENAVEERGEQVYAVNPLDSQSATFRLYYPEGYRYVKTLYLPFAPQTRLDAIQLFTQQDSQLGDFLDQAVREELAPQVEEIRQKLASGESFDSLVAAFGQDEGMKMEPYRSQGYFMPPPYDQGGDSYEQALLGLEKAGDITEGVSYLGYWFFQAVEVVEEGPAPYDQVEQSIRQMLLTTKQAKAWTTFWEELRQEKTENGQLWLDYESIDQLAP